MLAWLAFIWMCDLFNTLSTGGVGGEERGGGGLGGIVFFHYGERDFFFPVRENAKRAAPYNGGVMGEAVRGVSVKDTLGSASRRTSRWSSFVFLAAAVWSLHVRTHKSTMWKTNVAKQTPRDLQLTLILRTEGFKNPDISLSSLFLRKSLERSNTLERVS